MPLEGKFRDTRSAAEESQRLMVTYLQIPVMITSAHFLILKVEWYWRYREVITIFIII
jgi:hypothetical protein